MTSIGVKTRDVGNVSILDLAGNGRIALRFGGGTVSLPKAIQSLLEGGHGNILLNLARVDNIDAAGLGELVSSQITVTEKGGHIKLLNLRERLRELMETTKLLPVFEVYDRESEAVDSFAQAVMPSVPEIKASAA